MGRNGCYCSFSLTLSTRDGLKAEDSSPELPGEMTLDLLPQRQASHVQKLMQTCGETKSFVLKTILRPSSASEISLGHKCLGCLDLSWNILWALLSLKFMVPWS